MKRCSNRVRLLVAVCLGMPALSASPGLAQIPVTDVAGNAQWLQQTLTQVKQLAQQAQSYGTQLQQYQTELQQYGNMVQNTTALPTQAWNTVQSDIVQVRSLSNAGSVLSGNAGSIITRLQSASGYANQATSLGNVSGQFITWQQTIGNNVSTMGRTLGLQQSQQQSDAALITQLQQHAQSATGQMQAIQAGNELAGANAAQLMQIQATLAATAQMTASNDAVTADRRASEDAAMLHAAQPVSVPLAGQAW